MKKFLSKEFIFEAKIEFGHYGYRENNIYLVDKPQKNVEINIPTFKEVGDVASLVIKEDLPHDMSSIYGIEIEPRIIAIRSGSLKLFFGIILTGYTLIGGYKSFFDSVELMKRHARQLLAKRLRDKLDVSNWDIEIESRYPSIERLRPRNRLKDLFRNGDIEEFQDMFISEVGANTPLKKRDGFFWYLLASNCVLLITLGFLVYAAIQKTYFHEKKPNNLIQVTPKNGAPDQ